MEYTSEKNELILESDSHEVNFNGEVFPFQETSSGFTFKDYVVTRKGDCLVIKNIDVLKPSLVYILKKDSYIRIYANKQKINFEDKVYHVSSSSAIGSTNVYICEAGTLEISNNEKRKNKWNGITISKL